MAIFKTIKAFKKADDLVVKIYDKTKDFPRHELYGLTSQLRRSAVSVCANIAEGAGRGSLRDYIRFLNIAKGSLSEVEYLLHIAHRLGYLSDSEYGDFASNQEETAKILTGFIKAKQRQLHQETG